MKKFGLILAVCLAFVGIYGAHADTVGDATRAAIRRTSSNSQTISSRQNTNKPAIVTTSRGNNVTATQTNQNVRGRGTKTQNRTQNVTERTTGATARNTGNVVSRAMAGSAASRTTTPTTRTVAPKSTTRTAKTTGTATSNSRAISRAATTGAVTRDDILNRNYSKCKTVFFDCMDEFCANKDAQLKRCACSSRINEFDSIKKQLDKVEDKMLDFNQRLLTVNMEKEDAAALSVATEGETTYLSTKDNSDSKKTLDAIAKKLNTSFDTSNFNNDLNVLSWSLDIDAAFDDVDSLRGASTTTKTGTALYSAALPVCRQMAAEVCAESDISLAEGGYQALIEQDCNAVSKTYSAQTAQARSKVLEGSALLDMSRLDVYQKRNSDDILTCKKKMLDMLTDSTVCGEDLGNCLDITGQYINPSTGEVFLTPKLSDLGTLLTRPSDGATWTSTGKNSAFVAYLDSKKKFLEPATEHCQVIADDIWDAFVEDALAQIKLAQDKKLDDVRQSCTILTAQCLSAATESIKEFDSRALSTFGVTANKTANALCNDVITSCTALLNTTNDGGDTWESGITGIQIETTYETLMQTCRQVGRACIIQVCTSTSGNFGLCENISTSVNRKTIINREACWNEVKECIANVADNDTDRYYILKNIITNHVKNGSTSSKDSPTSSFSFYKQMYGSPYITQNNDNYANNIEMCIAINQQTEDSAYNNCIYDICTDDCRDAGTPETLAKCWTCRFAERIWGNCEVAPNTDLNRSLIPDGDTYKEKSQHNQIKSVTDGEEQSLLYWFAVNTGTETLVDSCRDTSCPAGYHATGTNGICQKDSDMCLAGPGFNNNNETRTTCTGDDKISPIGTSSDYISCICCITRDSAGNCCASGKTVRETLGAPFDNTTVDFCVENENSLVITEPYTDNNNRWHVLICDGGTISVNNDILACSGTLVDVWISTSDEPYNPYNFYYYSPTNPNFVINQIDTLVVENNAPLKYTWLTNDIDNYGDIPEFCSKTEGVTIGHCVDHQEGKTISNPLHWMVRYPSN